MIRDILVPIFVGVFMAMAGILIGQATDREVKGELVIISEELDSHGDELNRLGIMIAVGEERIKNAVDRQDERISYIEEAVCREEDVHGQ